MRSAIIIMMNILSILTLSIIIIIAGIISLPIILILSLIILLIINERGMSYCYSRSNTADSTC